MPLSIELSDDEQRRFDALATRADRPTAAFAHDALVAGLDELEEIAWAEDAAREWIASDQSTRSLDDTKRELGL
jgi:predicted DNA-binding protein